VDEDPGPMNGMDATLQSRRCVMFGHCRVKESDANANGELGHAPGVIPVGRGVSRHGRPAQSLERQ